jgi:biotin carboxylase
MANDKTLQIVGGGFEQVPAIEMAKKMGYRVVVTDMNPKAPGAGLADAFGCISTKDFEGNLAFARAQSIDGIMTLGSELAVPVVAKIAQTLGLPGMTPQTALAATNKNIMRERFVAEGVPTPVSQKIDQLDQLVEFAEKYGFPLVLKPSDCSGQRGVTRMDCADMFAQALTEALRFSGDGYAIIEEYIEGPEINVTAAVQDAEIRFLSFSHRITASPPHFGIAIEHRAPVSISADLLAKVESASRLAIQAIGLQNGIAYPQVIASETKGAKVLEIAARIPGGYMRDVGLILSGIDMIEVSIRQALADTLPLEDYPSLPSSQAVRVKFITELDRPEMRVLNQKAGFEQIQSDPGVYLAECRLNVGDPVPDLTSSAARFGAIIVRGDSLETVNHHLNQAWQKITLQ